jgi:hypothetical protein
VKISLSLKSDAREICHFIKNDMSKEGAMLEDGASKIDFPKRRLNEGSVT